MELPTIDIDIASVPLLDTAVGLFGSIVDASTREPSLFEVTVTIALIIYD